MRILKFLMFLVLLQVLWIMPVSAQDESPELPPSVGLVDASLAYFNDTEQRIIFEIPEGSWLYTNSLQWFGDEKITFRLLPDSATQWFVDLEGNIEQLQLTQPLFDLPMTFSDDLQTVYYATESGSSYFVQSQRYLPVIAQDLTTGEQNIVGAVLHGDGCGGAYANPMQFVYDQESGYAGSQVYFDLIDSGIVYTASCIGAGINLLPLPDSSSENFPFSLDGLSRVAMSPDGTKIAGVLTGILPDEPLPIVVDLATHTSTFLQIPELHSDQFGWDTDGTLYFSTRAPSGDLVFNAGYTEDQIRQIELVLYPFIEAGYERDENYPIVPAYDVSIYRYDLETDEVTKLVTLENAYGVARLFMLDGEMVASVIPSGKAWLDAMLDGTLYSDNAIMMGSNYTQPYIVQLTGDDDSSVLIEGVTRLTVRP